VAQDQITLIHGTTRRLFDYSDCAYVHYRLARKSGQ
jgi:hypothetical protein